MRRHTRGLYFFTFCLPLLLLLLLLMLLPNAAGRHVSTKRSDQQISSRSPFKLTRITSEPTGDGNTIRLYLEGPSLPKVYIQRNYWDQIALVTEHPGDVVEIYNEGRKLFVYFLHPGGYQVIGLKPTGSSYVEETVPDIAITIPQGREIVFERGADTEVNVTVVVTDGAAKDMFLDCTFTRKSRTRNATVETRHEGQSPSLFETLDGNRTENGGFRYYRLKTSLGGMDGILGVHFGFRFGNERGNTSLVEMYYIQEDVPVYQQGHGGPFPEHFIGFDENPSTSATCSLRDHMPCILACVVTGDHPSPVQINRVDPHPGSLPSLRTSSLSNEGFRAIGMLVLVNQTSDNIGQYEFQCQSRSGQQLVSRNLHLMVVDSAHINFDLSSVSRVDNETTEIVCVAEGTPAPTLTFLDKDDNVLQDNSDSYDIEVVEEEEGGAPSSGSTSRALLRVHGEKAMESLGDVTCQATNQVFGRSFTDRQVLHMAYMDPEARYYLENHVVDSSQASS